MKLSSRSLVWLAHFYLCCLAHLAPGQGATYSKIEASFSIAGISTDPAVLFDYTQTDVEVGILQPDSSTLTLPAFYDGGTTWRVRHTPTMAGNYQITGIQLNGAPISVGNLQPTNWIVTGFPASSPATAGAIFPWEKTSPGVRRPRTPSTSFPKWVRRTRTGRGCG
jgi:hypothetical protein